MDNGASSYRRFLDGDESAFDAIMQELFHSLVFFINRYVQDFHAAEDLAMDAMSDLIVHPHRYNFKVTLKTYVFMLGRSRALDYIKHKKIIPFVELSQAESVPGEDMEDALFGHQQKQAVHAALKQLPENLREAVYLVYFAGMSYDEAAKIMKKTRKQVDNLLYRSKKALRVILGEGDTV